MENSTQTKTQSDYASFLSSKIIRVPAAGFDAADIKPALFPFQQWIVKTAIKKGRYAIFADCGLGKTLMQLEFGRLVSAHTGKPFLILAPLGVTAQTIKLGKQFGYSIEKFAGAESLESAAIFITNYEQIDRINASDFGGVALDESSILKNFNGIYKRKLVETFADTRFKLCLTATPSPNDLNEIGNHSEFLDVLDAQDMRTKWFVRDNTTNTYRLKNHAKKDFYGWISSWACMLSKPSDIGFDDEGYILPPLEFIERKITTEKRDNGLLFNEVTINATNFNHELRITKVERLSEVAEIVNASDENFIVWLKQNEEGDLLKTLIAEAVEVRGSDKPELKEKRLLGFAENDFRVLVTKAKIAQFGLNYQNCRNQIFASLDFSFESLYQAIRRSYRFGQTKAVNIYIVTTDTMENVIASIKQKESQFMEMQSEMNKFINGHEYGLVNTYDFDEYRSEWAHLMKGDSVQEIKRIPDDSIDFIVFSPPFSSLFTYSNYIHDMGNNESHARFFEQYSFLLKELYRVLKPGRLMSCHTKDLAVYKNSSGFSGIYDFTGEHHRAVEAANFKYHSKTTIWTDPVLERARTNTQRLLYGQVTSDSSYSGTGMPEYITTFRKWEGDAENWEPVKNLNRENFPLEVWQQWASPIWMDIKRTDVLNNREGTAQGDEKHIAPLQLEVIHRLVNLYSNEGETVLTPFLGIGSEVYMAIKNKRKGVGIELKDSYFATAIKNVKAAEGSQRQRTIFEIFEMAATV